MSQVKTNYISKLRAEELEQELKFLLEVKQPDIAKKILEAREMGNLQENSSFDLYIEEQELVTSRVRDIQNLLASAKIIKDTKFTTVEVGTTVIVEVEGRQDEFTIVGVSEVQPTSGRISHESPVGKALLGAATGQEVLVETEVYSAIYKIINIK
ncbi:transcription elongation factor GreA [bacterium]|nr:transcription elongation factor GreA [bacterium]